MSILLAALLILADPAATKPLPPVVEPNWAAWSAGPPEADREVAAAWKVLREARIDRQYKDRDERQAAMDRVDAAHKTLEDHPDAACAAGAQLLRTTDDDWERLMAASTLTLIGKEKGEPFLVWAMAKSQSVDPTFEASYAMACHLADRHQPGDLPALFLMLRAHDGKVFLFLHSWYIPTPDCLCYVFGRYGREVLPYLRPMLGHDDPYVRRNAAIVLGYFGDQESRPELIRVLKANDVGSGGAAATLGTLGATEVVGEIAALLDYPDPLTRFWTAFGLYELASKDALPALERRLEKETEEPVKQEIQAAIAYLRADAPIFGANGNKLEPAALAEALAAAEADNGLRADFAAIAASAGPNDLDALERIRVRTTHVPSDLGNRRFHDWTNVINAVRRRARTTPPAAEAGKPKGF